MQRSFRFNSPKKWSAWFVWQPFIANLGIYSQVCSFGINPIDGCCLVPIPPSILADYSGKWLLSENRYQSMDASWQRSYTRAAMAYRVRVTLPNKVQQASIFCSERPIRKAVQGWVGFRYNLSFHRFPSTVKIYLEGGDRNGYGYTSIIFKASNNNTSSRFWPFVTDRYNVWTICSHNQRL